MYLHRERLYLPTYSPIRIHSYVFECICLYSPCVFYELRHVFVRAAVWRKEYIVFVCIRTYHIVFACVFARANTKEHQPLRPLGAADVFEKNTFNTAQIRMYPAARRIHANICKYTLNTYVFHSLENTCQIRSRYEWIQTYF